MTTESEARTDQLTGLANRRAWEESAPRELGRAARHGLSATLALLDVDDLKRLNDTQGHAAGDALLRAVAVRWRAQIRDADLRARVGGDEFALLLVPSQEESGATVVERLGPRRHRRRSWILSIRPYSTACSGVK